MSVTTQELLTFICDTEAERNVNWPNLSLAYCLDTSILYRLIAGTWRVMGGPLAAGGPSTVPMGYATGTGGTVTQLTSKATGVTLHKLCGRITTHTAALAAAAEVTFVVTNNQVTTNSIILVNIQSGGTAGSYIVSVGAVGNGTFNIVLGNMSTGSLSQAVLINFMVFNGSIA